MTAIVTGSDGRSYVHELAGDAPVFVTGAARTPSAPIAVSAGHARLVAWLLPMEPGCARRARVRLPAGQIVEVAAETVCSAANIARVGIAPARRHPAAIAVAGHQARLQRPLCIFPGPQPRSSLHGAAAPAAGSASSPAEGIGARKRRPAARPTAR